MVSVVIPARDAASTIAGTIDSLAPDRSLIGEIVLVDDGSTDGTARVAANAAARHGLSVRIVSGRFGGAGGARNAGIAGARGRYLFFLDADDEVLAGGLGRLYEALTTHAWAGLAVGSVVRRTAGRPDKTKVPRGYGADLQENAARYLRNDLLPIAMGSALVAASAVGEIRFPTSIGLDEDTCFWAAVLTRTPVVAVVAPVLLYHLDEPRMVERFVSDPRKALLGIALALDDLLRFDIAREHLQWRKAWVALRIGRLLIKDRRYAEAARILRMVRVHPEFRQGWKAFQYAVRIRAGRLAQAGGFMAARARRRADPKMPLPLRTLVLSYDPASPPVSGADLRNHGNAVAASAFGPTMLVSVRWTQSTTAAGTGLEMASLGRQGERQGRAVSRRRSPVEKRIAHLALERLVGIVQRFRPDAVVVEGVPLFAMLAPLRPLTRLLILDMHNVESLLAGQVQEDASWLRGLLPGRASAQEKIERRERQALSIVDGVWVCSQADRRRLTDLFQPTVPIHVVPNGIPRADHLPLALPPSPGKEAGWPIVLFIGHLGYEPNIVAARRLASGILPLIRRQLPKARLILAGRYPKPDVVSLARLPGVDLVANPEDLSTLLQSAHVTVIPLSEGGGTRIKILEAMAWGIPVVATPLAAEGQDFKPGEEIQIAETDEDLAQLVLDLCADPGRMERQRRAAHAKVVHLHGPAAIEAAVGVGLGLSEAGISRQYPSEPPSAGRR